MSVNRIPKQSYIVSAIKALSRHIAYFCPEPHIRIFLYKVSGILIGEGTYINLYTVFEDEYISQMIRLGKRVAVAKNVAFIASSHANNSRLTQYGTSKFSEIVVDDDAWIGAGVVVLPGVKIGRFSIIGSNAVVTKDVEPYSIITGIPGKRTGDVRERFGVI